MSNPPKRHKRSHHADVMVSSTSKDLLAHRKAAIDNIWRRGMYSLAMEKDTAESADAVAYSLKLVDEAEVYIGIFAHRYGYIPKVDNPDQISVTEMEYRRAKARKIPILIYIMAEDHPVKPADMEKGKGATKLKRLKKQLTTDHVVGFFTTPEDLGGKIFQGLTKLKEDGLIEFEPEAEEADTDSEQSFLPKPPAPYTPHRYILTQTFVGRKAELKLLDEWADSSDSTLIVEAIGGMGKSALTWEWFGQQERFAGRFWWSFYESDSAVTNFTRHALAYLTERPLKTFDTTPQEERERQLLALLAQKPYLLVLDGLERILVAYHRLDAPHLLDDEADTNRPDTQKGTTAGLRDCIDSRHADFLRKLAFLQNSKILISTRLIPTDLQNRAGQLLPSVRHLHLNGLADSDAIALMKHLGVYGDKNTMTRFLKQFDNHSLLLTIIAGRIRDYFPNPGYFDEWVKNDGAHLRLNELNLKQRRTAILEYALNGLKPELRKFLSQVAAFRYPVDYDTLTPLNPYAVSRPVEVFAPSTQLVDHYRQRRDDELNEERKLFWKQELINAQKNYEDRKLAYERYQQYLITWEMEFRRGLIDFHIGLKELEDRGLLQWERIANTYDLHPVVRAYAFEQLQDDERRRTFEHIRDHFESIPPKPLDDVSQLGDLYRDFEIYQALIGVHFLDLASDFYQERLADVLHFQLAAYHPIIELLTPFFLSGFDQPPALRGAFRQSARIADLANALSQVGRDDEAKTLRKLKLKIDLYDRNASNLIIGLENFSITLRSQGQLAASLRVRKLALDLSEAASDQYGIATANLRLMGLYRDIGQKAEVEKHYQAFIKQPPIWQTDAWKAEAESYYSEMLIQHNMNAETALTRAASLAIQGRDALNVMVVQRLHGEALLGSGKPKLAIEYFIRAAGMARQSGSKDLSMHLAGLARAYAQQGERERALRTLEEANYWSVDAAEIYLALGEREKAHEYAVRAYKSAWADGPPYSFWWYLERAKKVLDALSEPYPDLPPFDPSKVEPIPYEAEIRAFIEELKAEKAVHEAEEARLAAQLPLPDDDDFDLDDDFTGDDGDSS